MDPTNVSISSLACPRDDRSQLQRRPRRKRPVQRGPADLLRRPFRHTAMIGARDQQQKSATKRRGSVRLARERQSGGPSGGLHGSPASLAAPQNVRLICGMRCVQLPFAKGATEHPRYSSSSGGGARERRRVRARRQGPSRFHRFGQAPVGMSRIAAVFALSDSREFTRPVTAAAAFSSALTLPKRGYSVPYAFRRQASGWFEHALQQNAWSEPTNIEWQNNYIPISFHREASPRRSFRKTNSYLIVQISLSATLKLKKTEHNKQNV